MIFSLYVENVCVEALEDLIKVSGNLINNTRFVDDKAIITDSERDIQLLLDSINNAGIGNK